MASSYLLRHATLYNAEARKAADGWFAWSQRHKTMTIVILAAVMITAVMVFHLKNSTPSSARYTNMNIRYGADGFPRTDNEAEFVPPLPAAEKSSMAASKGTQGGTVW